MKKSEKNFFHELRMFFWPIDWRENKKFIPMALMMACILFNYATVRSIKDGLVMTNIGTEAVSFLKLYVVLPSAVLFMVIYSKLCNIMSQQKVFYTVTSFFIAYFTLFAFVFYPNPEFFHLKKEVIESWANEYPRLQWFIRIIGNWSYATFYVMAEMWGSMMLSLLFWQFANQITKTGEAKRFYSMFGLLGNFSLPLVAVSAHLLLNENTRIIDINENVVLIPVLCVTIFSSLIILFLYNWINKNVLTDPALYNPNEIGGKKKKKTKLSLGESFKMILNSKYLGLIAILVISYGISINLVEGVWKEKVRELHPTLAGYTSYMGMFQAYQGGGLYSLCCWEVIYYAGFHGLQPHYLLRL
jgi:AAA family ATP:ADP antiporter